MSAAIMTALAAVGFYPGTGHAQYLRFDSLDLCERSRPVVEAEMAAHGWLGVRTVCNAVRERGV